MAADLAIGFTAVLEDVLRDPAADFKALAIFFPKPAVLPAVLALVVTAGFFAAFFFEEAVTVAFICLYPHELLIALMLGAFATAELRNAYSLFTPLETLFRAPAEWNEAMWSGAVLPDMAGYYHL